jgi:hypothetical protein
MPTAAARRVKPESCRIDVYARSGVESAVSDDDFDSFEWDEAKSDATVGNVDLISRSLLAFSRAAISQMKIGARTTVSRDT